MIIRIALLLLFAAFALFSSVDLLLWLAIPGLPQVLTPLGLATLFSAFSILLIYGLLALIKLIMRACIDYLSAENRAHRRLLFNQVRQQQVKQLYFFKKVQLNYFVEAKRKKLLMANNQQHIHALSKAIDKELSTLKDQLSRTHYQALHHENIKHLRKRDINALLQLQVKIANIV